MRQLLEHGAPTCRLKSFLAVLEAAGGRIEALRGNSAEDAIAFLNGARERSGLSVSELARRAGLRRSHLSRLLSSRQGNMALDTFDQIVGALELRNEMRIVAQEEEPAAGGGVDVATTEFAEERERTEAATQRALALEDALAEERERRAAAMMRVETERARALALEDALAEERERRMAAMMRAETEEARALALEEALAEERALAEPARRQLAVESARAREAESRLGRERELAGSAVREAAEERERAARAQAAQARAEGETAEARRDLERERERSAALEGALLHEYESKDLVLARATEAEIALEDARAERDRAARDATAARRQADCERQRLAKIEREHAAVLRRKEHERSLGSLVGAGAGALVLGALFLREKG